MHKPDGKNLPRLSIPFVPANELKPGGPALLVNQQPGVVIPLQPPDSLDPAAPALRLERPQGAELPPGAAVQLVPLPDLPAGVLPPSLYAPCRHPQCRFVQARRRSWCSSLEEGSLAWASPSSPLHRFPRTSHASS